MQSKYKKHLTIVVLSAVVISLGVLTGWVVTKNTKGGSNNASVPTPENISPDEVGMTSEEADTAEGKLEEGGIEGEGTHHLIRPGGETKTVYLTSTVIDLSSFVGKEVQVWGQTMQAQQASWLMDVEKVKVIK